MTIINKILNDINEMSYAPTFPNYFDEYIDFLNFIKQLCNSNKIKIENGKENNSTNYLIHLTLAKGSKSSTPSQLGEYVKVRCRRYAYSVYNSVKDTKPQDMNLTQVKSYLINWSN